MASHKPTNFPRHTTSYISKSIWLYSSMLLPSLLGLALLKLQTSPVNLLPYLFHIHGEPGSGALLSTASEITRFEEMRREYAKTCPEYQFRAHIFSTDPIIIYLEDYLHADETRYLLDLAKPLYKQSPVSKGFDLKTYDQSIRSSQSAVLPDDPVVSCVGRRSVELQGYEPQDHLEDIQVVKYGVNDQFRPHFDWFSGMENPRISTIFAYLECDHCVGGATQFPHVEGKFSAKWCKFIDCETTEDGLEAGGVGFKPLPGNAVFWSNLYPNGTGHPGVWHAGMPVRNGTKVGLNIFTRRDVAYP